MARKTIQDRNARMLKAARDGMPAPQIAETFGLSPSHVYRTLKSLGAPAAEGGISTTDVLRAQVSERFTAGRASGYSLLTDSAKKDVFGNWKPDDELARTGLRRFGGQVDDDYDRVFRQGLDRRIRVYREMGDEPVIAATLEATRMPLRRLSWRVETDGESEDDKKAVEFVETCMQDMSSSWPAVVDQALSMLQYGFSISEMVYKKRIGNKRDTRSKYDDGRIGWRKFVHLAPDSLAPGNEWIFDQKGGVQGVVQSAAPEYVNVPISIEKLLLFRTTDFKGNPEGRSLLRSMYIPWYFKRNLEELEAISAERSGAGFPVVYAGSDVRRTETADSDIAYLREIARNIRVDEQMSVVLPWAKMGTGAKDGEGVLFELVRPAGTVMDFNQIIVRHEQRMAMVGLGQFLMLGMNKIGTQALASEQTDFFELALEGWMEKIVDVLNRYAVERLIDLNHFPGLTAYPRLRPEPVVRANIGTFSTAINQLASAQLITPGPDLEKYIRNLFDMPEIDPEVLAAKEEQAKEMALNPPPAPGTPGGPPLPGQEPVPPAGDGPDNGGKGGDTKPKANGGQGGAGKEEKAKKAEAAKGDSEKASETRSLADIFVAGPVEERPAWLGFSLSGPTGTALALPGGEPAYELHVTIAMLDRADVLDEERAQKLRDLVGVFVSMEQGLDGLVTGPAVFAGDGETKPLVALVDVPGLPEWRARLTRVLERGGFRLDRRHGYIPHVTLAYLPADAGSLDVAVAMGSVAPMPIRLNHVRLNVGGLGSDYALRPPGAPPEGFSLPKAHAADEEVAGNSETLGQPHFTADLFADPLKIGGPSFITQNTLESVREYEALLRDHYIAWANTAASTMAELPTEEERHDFIDRAVVVLLAELAALGVGNLPDAAFEGLEAVHADLSPQVLAMVAGRISNNNAYLDNLTRNSIADKVHDALHTNSILDAIATGAGAGALAAVLLTFLNRVASYAGEWWSIFNQAVGLATDEQIDDEQSATQDQDGDGKPDNKDNDDDGDGKPDKDEDDDGEREPEPIVAIFWAIEPGAEHCQTCLEFGQRFYRGYQDLLYQTGGITPANGTQCHSNCRCHLVPMTRRDVMEAYVTTGGTLVLPGEEYSAALDHLCAETFRYNPGQPRDRRGRFASSRGGAAAGNSRPDFDSPEYAAEREAARTSIVARAAAMDAEMERSNAALDDARGRYASALKSGDKAAAERLNADVQQANKAARDAAMAPLTVEHPELRALNPMRVDVNVPDVPNQRQLERGVAAFSNMVDASNFPEGATANVTLEVASHTRSYYDFEAQKVVLSSSSSDATLVHEMGHWLEVSNPRIYQAAEQFRDRRTQGEDAISMAEASGDPSFSEYEYTKKDNFIDPYVGKLYPFVQATEVVSMGLEMMHRDPARLASEDPDYFNFVYDVMKGRYAVAGSDNHAADGFMAANQPRDERGRWTTTGGVSGSAESDEKQAMAQAWIASLTDGERTALYEWGRMGNNIRDYQKGIVREGQSDQQRQTTERHAQNFESALEKGVRYEGEIYRGMTQVDPEMIDTWEQGGTLTLTSDLSFSRDAEYVRQHFTEVGWGGGARVMIVANQRTGVDLLEMTKVTDGTSIHTLKEQEVVGRKGTSYAVDRVDFVVTEPGERYGKTFPEAFPDFYEGSPYSFDNPPPRSEFREHQGGLKGYYRVTVREP